MMSPQRHEVCVLVKRGLLIANHSPQAASQTRNPFKLNQLSNYAQNKCNFCVCILLRTVISLSLSLSINNNGM